MVRKQTFKEEAAELEAAITPEFAQVINGYIMGDGHLKANGTLTIDQGHPSDALRRVDVCLV
jgi:hypothetical protein